jgi:hypothetical protein
VFAHELATLNEYKEENRGLKETNEHLRTRNSNLLERNAALKLTAEGHVLALDTVKRAIHHIGGAKLVKAIGMCAKDMIGVQPKDTKPNKRNRPSQVAATQ